MFPNHNLSLSEGKAGTEAEVTEEYDLLTCSPWYSQLDFFYIMQDPLPRGGTAHGGPGLPIVRQCPTDLPPGQSGGDYSSSKVPSPQLTLVCVKLAKSHVHSLRTLLRVGTRALVL